MECLSPGIIIILSSGKLPVVNSDPNLERRFWHLKKILYPGSSGHARIKVNLLIRTKIKANKNYSPNRNLKLSLGVWTKINNLKYSILERKDIGSFAAESLLIFINSYLLKSRILLIK